jgi:hypothetical protein
MTAINLAFMAGLSLMCVSAGAIWGLWWGIGLLGVILCVLAIAGWAIRAQGDRGSATEGGR